MEECYDIEAFMLLELSARSNSGDLKLGYKAEHDSHNFGKVPVEDY